MDEESTMIRRAGAVAPASGPLAHALVLAGPDGSQRRIWLTPEGVRIGRTPGNDLVLADPEVSRSHCVVSLDADGAVVADLGSTNGTFLARGRLSGTARLRHGDSVRISQWTLRYEAGPRDELERAAELERELERAGAYIRGLLPAPLTAGPVLADWRFLPCARIGGDAFGYRFLTPDLFAVFLLDVAGHGAGSALLAASVMNHLRELARSLASPAQAEPAVVLAALNEAFAMEEQGGLFFSAWYGLYDLPRRRLAYASAGHHPAFLRQAPAAALTPLATRNPAIGVMPGVRFRAAETTLAPAARLLLFSDGAFETTAPDGTIRRLDDFVTALARPLEQGQPGFGAPAAVEVERLVSLAREGARPGPFEDDVCILCLDLA
jgi:serine phosphatase RsbU (regulator of sigma subunit)